MSRYRDKIAGEVGGGANRRGLAPYFASVKQIPPTLLNGRVARLRPLKAVNLRNNEGFPSPTLCNAK